MRDTRTRIHPRRTRLLAVSSAALLAILGTVAYLRTTRPASSHRGGAVPGRSGSGRAGTRRAPLQPSEARAVPDFIEVGPDQYKPATAASDAEVEAATNRLLRQAVASAEEAAASAGTAGAYGTLTTADPELVARADALKAEAEAMQSYLQARQQRS